MISPPTIAEVHYRVPAPVQGSFPGHHRSHRGESGFEFRGHASLLDAPDPRRLDLHASLRDPFGSWIVRVYSQRMALPVVVVGDVSASMGFVGEHRKLDVLAAFTESLGWSAWRTGDSFGFIGCDDAVRDDFRLAQTRTRGAATPVAQALRALRPEGCSADGLAAAHRLLPRQKALVFLVSDFHFALTDMPPLFATFAGHDVVPVVIWDPLEFRLSADHGLAEAMDAESGARRLVWWRPALRKRWADARAARHEALLRLFQRHRLHPIFIEGAFDADAVTRHFQA